jgi:uncharacterized protein (TIGR03437 family)
VRTRKGIFQLRRPTVYQQDGGTRHRVSCRYVLTARNEVSFAVGRYDSSRPLVIDPVLSYSTYLGGANSTAVRVALDPMGNAYLAGATTSPSFPVTPGAVEPPSYTWRNDVLVSKFNGQGTLIYSTHVGGTRDDIGLGIAVDSRGQAYVTGSTASRDFPTVAAVETSYQGAGDAFVFALDAAGTGFVYSTYLGGSGVDAGTAIAVDAQGNAYVAGATSSTNFPTLNALQSTLKGGKGGSNQPFFALGDVFVSKLSPAGALVYSTYYGGSDDEAPAAIAVDSSGSPYVAGFTTSTDFPLKSPLQAKYGGAGGNSPITTGDAFIFKLTPDGSQAVYSTYLGGSADDVACGIAVDSSGNAYVAGSTFSTNFPTMDAFQPAYGGQGTGGYFRMFSGDAFLAKINPSGSALVFSTYLGGSDDDRAFAVAVDMGGNIYVAGNTASANFPVTGDAFQPHLGGVGTVDLTNLLPGGFVKAPVGFGDAFYARFTPSGSLAYATYLGGSDDDVASGLAVDVNGDVFLSGNTVSANFPLAGSSYQNQLGPVVAQDSTGKGLTSLLYGDAFFAIFSAGTTTASPVITSVLNQASLDTRLAPGTAALVNGSNLPASASAGAMVGGQPATVLSATATQWTIAISTLAAVGPGTVQIGTSAPFNVTLTAYAPALYSSTSGGNGIVSALRSVGAGPTSTVSASNPALPGDTIRISATGFGANPPAGSFILLAGVRIAPSSLGAVAGSPGMYQASFTMPQNIPGGNQNISITVGGQSSNTLSLPVQSVSSSGPVVTAAQNGASYQDGFPVGAWLQVKGTNLATVTDTWVNAIVAGVLPTQLDGVTVTVGGQPAYIYYVSPTQINVVAPDIAAGPATVIVKNSLGTSTPFSTTGSAFQPAFFPLLDGYIVATHNDATYSLAVKNGTYPGLTTVPAKPGDVLILWGTGFGPTTPAAPAGVQTPSTATFLTSKAVTVTIGGQPATVYGTALAPGFAALYQVAIQVPSTLADGDYSIVATVNGVSSPASALLTVQQ